MFTEDDYDILLRILANFENIITTPNVLTEVSNFVGQLSDPVKAAVFLHLHKHVAVLGEKYITSTVAAGDRAYSRLGLTDAGLLELASAPIPVFTDDLDLYLELSSRNHVVYYFTHFRFA